MTTKSLFQQALQGNNLTGTPPIWFMRQAGRYHSHYQNLRAKHSFAELCKKPELACEVALGPVNEFGFDAAILFSDILFPLEALGFGLEYTDHGPQLSHRLSVEAMGKFHPTEDAAAFLKFQSEAIKLTRRALPASIGMIGFNGGPWTLFSYAVEGHHTGGLLETKKHLNLWNEFQSHFMPVLKANIASQLEAGADVVMLFDTAAGELSPLLFSQLVVPQLKKLFSEFPGKIGYYSKGTLLSHIQAVIDTGPEKILGLGVDHRWSLPKFLSLVHSQPAGFKGFVQGNFDQALLHAPKDDLKKYLNAYLEEIVQLEPPIRSRWVCGLGHGVLPKTPMDNVKLFIDTVRNRFQAKIR